MKKILTIISIFLFYTLSAFSLQWEFDTGHLIISGQGDMPNYGYSTSYPWNEYRGYITKITIEDGVTSLGDHAFSHCINVTEVKIPDSVKSIGEYAFSNCFALTQFTIPDSLIDIGDGVFSGCTKLEKIIYQNNEIKDFFIWKNKLITYLGNDSFVKIPETVTDIGGHAFTENKSLISVEFPPNLISIGHSAFYQCENLFFLEIPEGVTFIGDYAFRECHNLNTLIIPKSVTTIGKQAFYSPTNLQVVYCPSHLKDYFENNREGILSYIKLKFKVIVNDSFIGGEF